MNNSKNNIKKDAVVIENETNKNIFVSSWNFGRKKGEYTCSSITQKETPTFVISAK